MLGRCLMFLRPRSDWRTLWILKRAKASFSEISTPTFLQRLQQIWCQERSAFYRDMVRGLLNVSFPHRTQLRLTRFRRTQGCSQRRRTMGTTASDFLPPKSYERHTRNRGHHKNRDVQASPMRQDRLLLYNLQFRVVHRREMLRVRRL